MFRRLVFALLCLIVAGLGVPAVAHAAPEDISITAPDNSSADTTPLIQGTADPGLLVHVAVDGVDVGTNTTSPQGTWEFQVVDPFTPGSGVSIEAQIRDENGQVLGSTSTSYYVWEEPSAIDIVVPTDGAAINGHFDLIAQVTNPGQMTQDFTLLLDGTDVPTWNAFMDSMTGELSIRVQDADLPEGRHELTVTGVDGHGRPATSDSVTVNVDMTPPSKPVVTSHHDGDVITDRTPTFAGTADPGTSVEIEFYGSGEPLCDDIADAAGRWSCQPTGHGVEFIEYMEGKREDVRLVIGSRDAAGNAAASQLSVVVDFRAVTGGPTTPIPTTSTPTSTTKPTPTPAPTRSPVVVRPTGNGDNGGTGGATPDLAYTGASPVAPLLVAGAMIVVGFGMRRFSRTRTRG